MEVGETLEKFRKSHQRKSRLKRKEPPESLESEEEGDMKITILKYAKQGKPGVEARKIQDGGVQYSCLLCKTQQKQIVSHIKKEHSDMLQNGELEELQVSLKEFSMAVRNSKRTKKAKREAQIKHRKKRRAEDPDAGKESNRLNKARCVAKKKEENQEAIKEDNKRWNEARRVSGPEKFVEENKHGHIFPCACCHTLKRRDQVVELHPQQADKIDGKARENHQTLQVIVLYDNY